VEYFRVLYRSDRVRFHLESRRKTDRVVRLVPPAEGDTSEDARPKVRRGSHGGA